jgi:hypothetical protein
MPWTRFAWACVSFTCFLDKNDNDNTEVESGVPYEELFADVLCPPYLQQQ